MKSYWDLIKEDIELHTTKFLILIISPSLH